MSQSDPLPDIIAVLRDHLRSAPGVTAIVAGRSSLALDQTLPAIRYAVPNRRRVGPQEWTSQVQVECWDEYGQDRAADELADAVVQSVPALAAEHRPAPGRVVIDVCAASVSNVFPSPDNETGRPRVVVLLDLLLYAHTASEAP